MPDVLNSELTEQHKGHGASWTKWLGHLKDTPCKGLELGCWLGESAEWFMEHVNTHPDSMMYTVDTFSGSPEHRLGGVDCSNNERTARGRLRRFGERCQVIKGESHRVIRSLTTECFDWAYVDADHGARNVLRDGVYVFDCMKVGGTIIFDDYLWEVFEAPVDRPKMAIDAFVAAYARQVEVIGMGPQVALRKTAP